MIPAANLLIEKLRNVEARYEELNQLLAEPEVVLDSKRYLKTAKAHSDIGEIVSKFREYKDLERGISETGAMVREETDPELKAICAKVAAMPQRRGSRKSRTAASSMRNRSQAPAVADRSQRRAKRHPGNPRRDRWR